MSSSLVYPAYVFWEEDCNFHEIEDLGDIECSFEVNDLDENLIGWDSNGRRFTLILNKEKSCCAPLVGDIDLPDLEEKVAFHNNIRKNEHYAEEVAKNGECSPRKMRSFLESVRRKLEAS